MKKWIAGAAGAVAITAALLAGGALYAGEETAVCDIEKKQTCDQRVCPVQSAASTEG